MPYGLTPTVMVKLFGSKELNDGNLKNTPPIKHIPKEIRKKLNIIILSALIGGASGGLINSLTSAHQARNPNNSTTELKAYKNQYEAAFKQIIKDGFIIDQHKNIFVRNTKIYTVPLEKVDIITYKGPRSIENSVELVDVFLNPERYKNEYKVIRKYLSNESINKVQTLMKMEPKVHNELQKIRQNEKAARISGFKKGTLKGINIGTGVGVGLIGANAMRKKLGNRRRR